MKAHFNGYKICLGQKIRIKINELASFCNTNFKNSSTKRKLKSFTCENRKSQDYFVVIFVWQNAVIAIAVVRSGVFMSCFYGQASLQFKYANKALKRRSCDATTKLFVQHKYRDYDVIDFIYADQSVRDYSLFFISLYLTSAEYNTWNFVADDSVWYILFCCIIAAKFVQLSHIWEVKCLERKKKLKSEKNSIKAYSVNIRKNVAASHAATLIYNIFFTLFFHSLSG